MADEEQSAPLRIISSKVLKGEGIRAVLEMLMRDHSQFESLVAVAVIPTGDSGMDDAVVYTTNLNFLEKIGLLDQAKQTVRNGS